MERHFKCSTEGLVSVRSNFCCEELRRFGSLVFIFLLTLGHCQHSLAQTKIQTPLQGMNNSNPIASGDLQTVSTGEADWTRAALVVRQRFELLDRDQDSSIDLSEFLSVDAQVVTSDGVELEASGKTSGELKRDFLVFDFDHNAKLSFREFAAIPGWVDPPFRGAIPDPFSQLVADAVAALDESYDRWDQRPEELINAHTFVGNFLGSIIPEGNRFVTGRVIDLADLNLDGKVSRLEARHFLEQQLGVRLRDGHKLRDPAGRVVRFDWLLELDQDQDGELDQGEVETAGQSDRNLFGRFGKLDLNRDQRIDYEELSDPFTGCFFDPVLWFCEADTNLNSFLEWSELADGLDLPLDSIQRAMFYAFDDNQDSRLTLQEYLVSPLGNRNYAWQRILLDRDGDQKLSFNEFEFGRSDLFQLQRRYYFHRLDSDADGTLSRDELLFESLRSVALAVLDPKNKTCRMIIQDPSVIEIDGFSLHPNGDTLLIHRVDRNSLNEPSVVRVSLADGHFRELCKGRFPTWAPDGTAFVCERSHRGVGIWLMEPNGLSGRMLSNGRCPSWSPDGRQIAFFNEHGVSLYDCVSQSVRKIFLRDEHRHRSLGDRIVWASDSRAVVFTGHSPSGGEVFVLRFNQDFERVSMKRLMLPDSMSDVFAWKSPDCILLKEVLPKASQKRFSELHFNGEFHEGVSVLFGDAEEQAVEVEQATDSGVLIRPNSMVSGRQVQDGRWFFSILSN